MSKLQNTGPIFEFGGGTPRFPNNLGSKDDVDKEILSKDVCLLELLLLASVDKLSETGNQRRPEQGPKTDQLRVPESKQHTRINI